MCRFFAYCDRPCKTSQSHFAHWKHVRLYCKEKDPDYLSYNLYRRLIETDDPEVEIMLEKKRQRRTDPCERGFSQLINQRNYEKYLISHMVKDMLRDMIAKIG